MQLIEGLEFTQSDQGWRDSEELGYRTCLGEMAGRLSAASAVDGDSITGAENERLWAEAVASIQDEAACPMYGGLKLTPQRGLLPIGRDPRSGLWEFAAVQTGMRAGVSPARRSLFPAMKRPPFSVQDAICKRAVPRG